MANQRSIVLRGGVHTLQFDYDLCAGVLTETSPDHLDGLDRVVLQASDDPAQATAGVQAAVAVAARQGVGVLQKLVELAKVMGISAEQMAEIVTSKS